jgi:hypothetical protein
MPRMSIDSKFSRDPRVLRLAKSCGWSRRETMGCLLDVWEVCYEQVSEVLLDVDIDAAAELDGFAQKLLETGLGRAMKRGIRIAGAKERIEYLKRSREAGRKGGIKSGESRRNSSKQPLKGSFSDPSQKTKPPDLVPDTPIATASERESADPEEPEPSLSGLPVGFIPNQTQAFENARCIAGAKGLDVAIELQKFIAHARSKQWTRADWTSAFVKWLLDARPNKRPSSAPAPTPRLRVVEPPPPEVRPLTAGELAEMKLMADAIAINAAAAAQALAQNGERRSEGEPSAAMDNHPRVTAKEATG